jgi:hypothetical protein
MIFSLFVSVHAASPLLFSHLLSFSLRPPAEAPTHPPPASVASSSATSASSSTSLSSSVVPAPVSTPRSSHGQTTYVFPAPPHTNSSPAAGLSDSRRRSLSPGRVPLPPRPVCIPSLTVSPCLSRCLLCPPFSPICFYFRTFSVMTMLPFCFVPGNRAARPCYIRYVLLGAPWLVVPAFQFERMAHPLFPRLLLWRWKSCRVSWPSCGTSRNWR